MPRLTISAACATRTRGPFVYRLYDADERLLYVGCTRQALGRRLGGHRRTKEWWPQIAFVRVESFETHEAALAAESVPRSRAEQGLPPTIEDPATLTRLAQLIDVGLARSDQVERGAA